MVMPRSAEQVRALTDALDLEIRILALVDGPLCPNGARPVRRSRNARNIVRAVTALLEERSATAPKIAQLSTQAGVSRRTLERAFHETFGISPAAYFRIRALRAARRQLLGAKPEAGIVTRVATGHGFSHLGRFAVSYRRLFGERPIDTLRGLNSA
jgi:AraC family ethanolamine operon transcriptional activator